MEEKTINPGDHVELSTREKSWQGFVLESHDAEIILLKLDSGYNIGLRESEILDVKVLKKAEKIASKGVSSFEGKKNNELKNVAMIITGGTISSRLDPKSGGVKWTSVEDIFNMAPELKEICNIVKVEKPFMKASEDMYFKDWKKIAEIAEKLLNDETIDGLIITHGTDTLHYTSAALSFFLGKLNKPVALTYSQRSIDRGSTDAHLNLICAARYAVSDIAEVALVGHATENDDYCYAMPGNKTRKMHTSKRNAFKVINSTPLAKITKDRLEILREFNARSSNGVKADIKGISNVALVKVYPGQSPDILNYYNKEGYRGVILEVTGLGHVPGKDSENSWLPTIKKLINAGMIICAAPQTIYGTLNPNVYSSGRDLQKTGLIFLKDILSEVAFVKLGWVLGHKSWIRDKEKVKEKMLENVSGEFSSC